MAIHVPDFFIEPAQPPRPIEQLTETDINSYLHGFYRRNNPTMPHLRRPSNEVDSSPYSENDLRWALHVLRNRRRPPNTQDRAFLGPEQMITLPSNNPVPPIAGDVGTPGGPRSPAVPAHFNTVANDSEGAPLLDRAEVAAGIDFDRGPGRLNSPAAHPPPAARARSSTAVVTPSAGSGVATAPPAPLQLPASAPPSKRTPPLEAEPGQRMMEFGLAMLASRSPHFGQTVGEAGQAVIASDRNRRTENREQQKADTEQQFREAYVRVQETQLALEIEPRTPANLARAATARAALMRAEADMMTARRGPAPQLMEVRGANGSSIYNMATGETRALPPGTQSAASAAQAEATQARRDATETQAQTRRDATDAGERNREVQMFTSTYNTVVGGLITQKTVTGEFRWTPEEIRQQASAAAWTEVNILRVGRGLPPLAVSSSPPGVAAAPGAINTTWRPTR